MSAKRWLPVAAGLALLALLAVLMPPPDRVVFRAGELTVTAAEVEATIDSYRYAQSVNPDIQIPTQEEALRHQLRTKLAEEKIQQYGITLTPEEEAYASSYAETGWQLLEEDAAAGDENSREILELMNNYIAAAGWTREEYNQLSNQSIATSILRQKLVEQVYGGDFDRLNAELDAECARLLEETAP